MIKTLFEYQDYRIYILDRLSTYPRRGHGMQAKLAKSIHCQNTYVSRVLKCKGHFNLEQADYINEFFGHTKEESRFFLLLVEKERAGTPRLRSFFASEIETIIQQRLILKNRLGVSNQLSESDKVKYYSHWYYSAVHIALTIPALQTHQALVAYFEFSPQTVAEILEFLVSCGLVIEKGGRYNIGTTRIHLGSDSPLISKSHMNWRIKAINSLEREDISKALHYSSVVSLSSNDITRIKSELVKAIESTKAIIRDSKEEELHAFCLDFFRVS